MPTVACYCHDFLKKDMQHVYRQITSLQGWKTVVICQKRENEEAFPFPAKRISLLPKSPWRWFRRQWFKSVKRAPVAISTGRVIELLKEVSRHEADVVHIFFGQIAVQLLPFIQACPKPVVVSFHGADVGVDVNRPAFKAALEGVFKSAKLILARSESLLEGLKSMGCPPEKLRLQRTGLSLDHWPHVIRAWPYLGEWKWLQACRLVSKKGLKTTLAAFRIVAQTFPNASLTIAGDGPMKDELVALVNEWGLADKVHFAGFLSQVLLHERTYHSHLFLHPSETPADGNREGVPNAMLEAMSSGLPILATNHGGIPEAVTDGLSGFLVEERDAEGLAKAALALMQDEPLFRKMALAASQEVAEKFERQRQTQILEDYYTEAASS